MRCGIATLPMELLVPSRAPHNRVVRKRISGPQTWGLGVVLGGTLVLPMALHAASAAETPAAARPPSSAADSVPGKFPFASQKLLTRADLSTFTIDDLRLMRNELFARHGHTFKSPNLRAHFSAQPWYKAQTADAGPLLTEIERKNIPIIKAAELAAALKAQADAEAALPADVREVWLRFRATAKSRNAESLAAMTRFPFIAMISGSREELSRSEFVQRFDEILPRKTVQHAAHDVPRVSGDIMLFTTSDEDPIDAESNAGRIFRFERKRGLVRLVGTFACAGPGDLAMDPRALEEAP